MTNKLKKIKGNAPDEFPGAAINEADDNKVDKKLIKERTKTINNNPRNDDML